MFARSDIKIDTVKQIDRQKCYKKISQYPGILAKQSIIEIAQLGSICPNNNKITFSVVFRMFPENVL